MANFTAADVKKLRDDLGAGMMDAKNALVEADGDYDKAVELLRIKGAKAVAKRDDRATSEGIVVASAANGAATVVELASETDFVAKNERFVALGDKVLAAVAAADATDVASANAAEVDGKTVLDVVNEAAAQLGEKIEIRTVRRVEGSAFEIYLHKTSQDLPPQIAVVVAYEGDNAAEARSIAQHIAFANPTFLTRDEIPAEDIEKERATVEAITREEGKPEAALPKIVEGRLNAYRKQVALLEQDYAKDNKISVAKAAENAGITIQGFARVKVGA
ncbi:elongation factor Ts [Curtobacterium luteum]|uniref:Elongation factor Ts n=1 Tax=Curtobacterium luteum TaxID=33881 RepID=A0A8H9G8I8_9MICO|nr:MULTISPECIES: translation elongation factor Ts [Curtobacterium]MBM7801921.1 elongation factor Ts [Curtobacterium luteum]NUU51766.1 elongation factor Ts [Curtobacterium luteum]GGK86663.1 elongation factor Ts [Curtobacterium luteum]